jgi:hypothetical protein
VTSVGSVPPSLARAADPLITAASKDCQKKHWPKHKLLCKESPIYKANQELAALKMKLASQEHKFGVDHEMTMFTMSEIGYHLRNQGKLNEAEAFFRRSLEGCERTLGPAHMGTLTSVCNLGTLL